MTFLVLFCSLCFLSVSLFLMNNIFFLFPLPMRAQLPFVNLYFTITIIIQYNWLAGARNSCYYGCKWHARKSCSVYIDVAGWCVFYDFVTLWNESHWGINIVLIYLRIVILLLYAYNSGFVLDHNQATCDLSIRTWTMQKNLSKRS